MPKYEEDTVVGANVCVRGPVKVKDRGIKGVDGVEDKKVCAVRTINIISRRQCFAAYRLSSSNGKSFGLHRLYICFPSNRERETHSLVPATIFLSISLLKI
jgi:hypothetical protein